MAKDIVTKAEILGGEIDVRANFGQTVKVTVSPDPYMGDTEVTPSVETQVLATKKKFVQDDITVLPAPTEALLTTENGQFTPSDGKVGFSAVTVDVNPDLRPLSVSENGQYSPDGFDGYSQVSVDVEQLGILIKTETLNQDYHQEDGNPFFWHSYFNLGAGIFFLFFDNNGYLDTEDKNRAVDMMCFVTSPDAGKKSVILSRNRYQDPRNANNSWSWASAGTTIRIYQIPYNLTHDA